MTTDNEETPSLYSARRQLESMRYRYGKSRPAATTLLQQFSQILDIAEETMAKTIEAKEREIDIRYQGRLEQSVRREDDARNLAESFRAHNEALRKANEEKRFLREARKRDGSDVEVTIDREYGSFWTIADIEEIAYRLRAAGGTDDTEVKSTTQTFTASVPDPNVVTLGRSTHGDIEESLAEVVEERWRRIWSRAWPIGAVAVGIPVLNQFLEWVI